MEIFDAEFWSIFMDPEKYRAMIDQMGPWAPLAAIGAMVVVSFLPLPAETIAVANGAAFGRLEGFVLTWIGAMIAAVLAFCLARLLGRPIVNRLLPKETLARFEKQVNQRGAVFLLLVRMIPFVPYTVVNYGSGLSPVRFRTYFWTSAVGMALPIFAFVSVGALMMEQAWIGWVTLVAVFGFFALFAYYTRPWWREDPSR
jgi:uncharacterized membrane protein YdjX (TVP38/TMEM64 family)